MLGIVVLRVIRAIYDILVLLIILDNFSDWIFCVQNYYIRLQLLFCEQLYYYYYYYNYFIHNK